MGHTGKCAKTWGPAINKRYQALRRADMFPSHGGSCSVYSGIHHQLTVKLPKHLESTVNEAFCLLTHPWKCCLPSSWHHRVASSAISESREETFIFFCNTLSFCLGQDVLIYHFLVNHKPEKDSGFFREGLHEALSHHESLLCQMLILHQKRVLLLRGLFFFFFSSQFSHLRTHPAWEVVSTQKSCEICGCQSFLCGIWDQSFLGCCLGQTS